MKTRTKLWVEKQTKDQLRVTYNGDDNDKKHLDFCNVRLTMNTVRSEQVIYNMVKDLTKILVDDFDFKLMLEFPDESA